MSSPAYVGSGLTSIKTSIKTSAASARVRTIASGLTASDDGHRRHGRMGEAIGDRGRS
jgi:hypothetical protein